MMPHMNRFSGLPLLSLAIFLGYSLAGGLPGADAAPVIPAKPMPAPAAVDGAVSQLPAPDPKIPFAVIEDETITGELYLNAVRQGMRKKFYHGAVPDGAMAQFQREVGRSLVERVLCLKEAARRGIEPDQEEIANMIAEYDKRYADAPRWRADRDKMLPGLTKELQSQSQLKRLEESVRKLPEPPVDEVKAYFDANPDKFTRPATKKLSLILLKVNPSAGGNAWKEAEDEAAKLLTKIRGGADFGELARIHSGDASASQGGVLDNTHQGTLSEEIEKKLETLKVGEVTEPIMVLEGIALFRLEDRTPPVKVSFEKAQERAQGLLMREKSESAWEAFKKQLWEKYPVVIQESTYYLPLPATTGETKKSK